MGFLSITPQVQEFLTKCRSKGAKEWVDKDAIDMDELYRLIDDHQNRGGPPAKIHELLEGSEVVERRRAEEAPMTELERLRMRAEERAYQRSVEHLKPIQKSKKAGEENNMSGFKWATNFGLQVIVAFIGAFALGYYFVETFVDPTYTTAKVLAGAGCSFATLLLEVILFVVHDQKEEMIKKKRQAQEHDAKKKRERHSEAISDVRKPAEEKKE